MFLELCKKIQSNISALRQALLEAEFNWNIISRFLIWLQLHFFVFLRAFLRVYAFLFIDDKKYFFILTGIEKNNLYYTENSYCVYKRFQKKTVGFGRAALAMIIIASIIGSFSLYFLMDILHPGKSTYPSEAAWIGGGTWNYRRAITLSSATTAANYQVNVQLTAANFDYTKLSFPTTGADLRFTGSDGTILQDYWIETWVNGGTSTIWVEVATSGTSTIYMYYGNSGASAASSGANTFIDFAGFESSVDGFDASGTRSTLQAYSGSYSYIPATGYTYRNVTVPTGSKVEAQLFLPTSSPDDTVEFYFSDGTRRYALNQGYPTTGKWGYLQNGTWTNSGVSVANFNAWQKISFTYIGVNNVNLSIGGTSIYTGKNGTADTSSPTKYTIWGLTGYTYYLDNILVRQYTATEPSTSLGTEEYFSYFTVTGTATMNAGASQVITITAKTNLDNTYTGYTGDKSLTFSGASVSGGGNNPTCSDKTSADVNFGTGTTVTFASGVATCTMKLYAAESISVDVTDGTINSTGSTSYDLDVAVSSPLTGAAIQINGTDAYTNSANTTLSLSATNASQMKFSNNNSSYSTYEAYGTSKAWDITNVTYGGTSSDGTKTVYVKYKDAYGNEASPASDNITYDTTVPVNPSSAADGQGAVTDTWQNNKNDPDFTSFTGESDTGGSGIAGFYVYFGTDSAGANTDNWVSTDAFNPASFSTSNTRYLRAIAKDNAGNYADSDGAGATCTNTNADRPLDADCWATIFIHKYDILAPDTPSAITPVPLSWTKTNSFNFSWTAPPDNGGSGVKDYTYRTNAGTSATTAAPTSVSGLTSDSDGTKIFYTKANDNAGNSGAEGSVNFYYDVTLPTNAGAATDGNGSLDNTWGTVSDPNFTWGAGSDISSGVKEYDVYWGTDSNGEIVTATVATNAYNPAAIPANTLYYLRIRTRDNALNESAWATKFTLKYSQAASSPSSLSQTANADSLALGDWTNDTTPTLNFTLIDPDSDTLGYVIKIDNNSDFLSPEVFYTYSANDLASGVGRSFTVGQAAGTGTYTNGAESQTLAESAYYWKVKAVESHGLASSEVTANSGAVAFGIDITAPIGTALGFGTIAADSITATVSGASDSGSGLHTTPYYFDNTTVPSNSGWQVGSSWASSVLTANTQYTFKVTSRDKAGNTQATGTQNKYTLANQVTGLSAANATDKTNYKINLTWTNQSQSGIKIEQDTGCNGYETTLYDNVSANPSSPYSVSAAANICYQFRISSYNGDGAINSTSIPETSQITTPAAQAAALAHTANTTASIDWDWADVSGATGYKVYRASDDFLLATIATATSNWTEDSLAADTQYSVYVRALNANGEGIASSSASAYTSANAPVSPAHSANAADSVTWTWLSGGAQKDFYAWTDTPAANSGWMANLFWNQGSLSANTQYTFFVKAENESGDQTGSTSNSAYSAQNTPTGISFDSVAANSITLSAAGTFSNLNLGSSGLYFLNVTNSNTPDWTQTNSWINSSLSSNTQYSFKVKSRNGDSDETSYTAESAKYTLANVPSAPTVDNAGPTTLDINVNLGSNSVPTEFAVYKETGAACDGIGGSYIAANGSDNGATAVWQTDALWATVTATGLAENTQYSFCVNAKNGENIATGFGAGAGGTTTVSNVAPLDPAAISPTSGIYLADTTPALSANYYDSDAGDTGTTNYRISSGTAQNCLDNVSIIASGVSVPTLTNNENTVWAPSSSIGSDITYYWCAQNNDGSLTSSWKSMGNFILDTAAPSGTTLTFGAVAAGSITAAVSGAIDSGSGLHATPYYFENITEGTNSGWTANLSWNSGSLSSNISYSFRIKSKDALGNESAFTSTQNKYTLANIPSDLSLTVDSQTQITASWSANSNPVGTQYYAENTTTGANSGWINSTSWVSTSLFCGTSYSFKVKARNSGNTETSFTDSVSGSTQGCGGGLPPAAYNPPSAPPVSSTNPQAGFKISINDNNQQTNTRNVILKFIVGADTVRMAISNTADFAGASQEPYQSSKNWTLSSGDGVKTVYTKFYTQYGVVSEIVSSSIILDTLAEITPKPESSPQEVAVNKPTPSSAALFLPEIALTPLPAPSPYFEASPEKPAPVNPNWNLIDSPKLEAFSAQSNETSFFTGKFSSLAAAFKKLNISQNSDIASRAPQASFKIPNFAEILGLESAAGSTNLIGRLADFSSSDKAKIPSEISFVSTASEKINFTSDLVLDEGSLKQKISAPSSTNLNIAIKPDHSARSISGYIALKKSAYSMNTNYKSIRHLADMIHNSYFMIQKAIISLFARNVFAQEKIKPQAVEQRFVLAQFQYADPDKDGIWTADIQTPAVTGEYEIISMVNYQDAKIPSKEIRLIAVIDPEGYVFRKESDSIESRLPGVVVSIYSFNSQTNQYEFWNAKDYDQKNPQITDATGRYSFLVPAGNYYLKAEAHSYYPYQSDKFVVSESGNVHMNLELVPMWSLARDWKIILLILFGFALAYNFYRDRKEHIN